MKNPIPVPHGRKFFQQFRGDAHISNWRTTAATPIAKGNDNPATNKATPKRKKKRTTSASTPTPAIPCRQHRYRHTTPGKNFVVHRHPSSPSSPKHRHHRRSQNTVIAVVPKHRHRHLKQLRKVKWQRCVSKKKREPTDENNRRTFCFINFPNSPRLQP